MKFGRYNCSRKWVTSKQRLAHVIDWLDTSLHRSSTHIGLERVAKAMMSSGVIGNVADKELEEIKRKKLQRMLQSIEKEGGDIMTVRIVVPVMDEGGLNARLSEHFGRAPYFAVIELDKNHQVSNQRTVRNVSEHFGGTGRPPDRILQLQPNALITYGMGPRALSIFQNARVAVLRANTHTVKGVITAYNNEELEELTEGCHHARHP